MYTCNLTVLEGMVYHTHKSIIKKYGKDSATVEILSYETGLSETTIQEIVCNINKKLIQ